MNAPKHDFHLHWLRRHRRKRVGWRDGLLEKAATATIVLASWINAARLLI